MTEKTKTPKGTNSRTTAPKDTEDGVVLRKNGTVKITANGEVITLAAPTFGQFKTIKRKMFEDAEELMAIAKDKDVDLTGLTLTSLSSNNNVEAVIDEAQRMASEVIQLAVELLGDKTLPDDLDDWPLWLVSSDTLLTDLMVHWKTVPLGRG